MKILQNNIMKSICSCFMFGILAFASCGQQNECVMEEEFMNFQKKIKTQPVTNVSTLVKQVKYCRIVNDPESVFRAYFLLFWAHSYQEKQEEAKLYLDTMAEVLNQYNLHDLEIHLYNSQSRYYYDINETDSNLIVLNRFYQKAFEIRDSANMAGALGLIGHAHQVKAQYDKALEYYNRSFELSSKINSEKGLQSIASHMSTYYARMGDLERAIRERNISLTYAEKLNDTLAQIRSLTDLSGHYALMKDMNRVKKVIKKRNQLIDQTEFPQSRKHSINMAISYIENEYFEDALKELNAVEQHYLETGNVKRLALIKHYKAIAHRGLDDYDRSAQFSHTAYNMSGEIDFMRLSHLSALTLFQTYHWRGKHQQAVEWLLKSQEWKERIFEEQKAKEILRLETEYETQRKEQEIILLKANSEIQRLKRNALWLALGMLASLGGALLYMQHQRNKKRRQIQMDKLRISELEKNQLSERLEFKQRELTSQLLFIAQKNEVLQGISNKLEALDPPDSSSMSKKLLQLGRQVRASLSSFDTWDDFVQSFKSIHKNFVQTLVEKYELNTNEIRLASLIKMNFSNKEIAHLLNISGEGIKKAKYRLRKKLNISGVDSLEELILNIN